MLCTLPATTGGRGEVAFPLLLLWIVCILVRKSSMVPLLLVAAAAVAAVEHDERADLRIGL